MKEPRNIERQCWICHETFLTSEGSKHILCHEHKKKWDYFWIIWWPIHRNQWLGIDLADDLYSWWFLNVLKKPHHWQDADPTECPRRWCRYCGKGKN